MMHINTI